MHLSSTHSETVTKPILSNIHALVTAVSLSFVSCVSHQQSSTPYQDGPKNDISDTSEGDIDNIEYCILVGTTAQIQAGIEFMADMRSLGTLQKFIQEEMKKENISGKVTVQTCSPTKNEEGIYTYITIHVSGVGTTEVYSRDPAIAQEITHQMKMNDDLYFPGVKF